MIVGRVTVIQCENCERLFYASVHDLGMLSKSELNKDARAQLNKAEWRVTREKKYYCPRCAKELGLRNACGRGKK